MSQYLLIPREIPQDFSDFSPADMQKVIEQYVAWGERISKAGKLLGSNKLKDGEGRILRGDKGEVVVTDGPFSETKEVIGGYWVIDADSYQEAVDMCTDHPHIKYGSSLEIRAIETM